MESVRDIVILNSGQVAVASPAVRWRERAVWTLPRLSLLLVAMTKNALISAVFLALATPAAAQAPQPPVAPWSPLDGRPETEGAMRLTPLFGPPVPTRADRLPIDRLRVPKGFRIEVFASGIANARNMRVGDKGTVFVGSRLSDKVYAIVGRGARNEVKVVASGLYRPNGLAFKDGTLYIAELSQISKIEHVEDHLDNPPAPTVIYDQLPRDEANGWKFIGIGPDNKLYVPVGMPCNNCIAPQTHGHIRRINLDGSDPEVVALGIRNVGGFDWDPVTKELYFTDNGRDWLSEDQPHDKLNRVTRPGEHFGAPYCYGGDVSDPEFGWGHSCNEFVAPVAKLGAHAAPLGMRFYTGTMFPSDYRNAVLIARHGSWNRTTKIGGDVVMLRLNRDGTVKSAETFVTGFLDDNNYFGRPVDIQPLKDGSVLISDDWNGAIYRVTSASARVAHDVIPEPAQRGRPLAARGQTPAGTPHP
jgi:glucose/arabinose dehydrogenase